MKIVPMNNANYSQTPNKKNAISFSGGKEYLSRVKEGINQDLLHSSFINTRVKHLDSLVSKGIDIRTFPQKLGYGITLLMAAMADVAITVPCSTIKNLIRQRI